MTGSPEEPQTEPSETARKQHSPVVGHRLDVGQQVHFEGVALLEGLPALRESQEGSAGGGFVPPSPPPPPRQAHTHLVAHVGLFGAVRLHVLGEPLLHGVDSAADRAGEGALLGSLERGGDSGGSAPGGGRGSAGLSQLLPAQPGRTRTSKNKVVSRKEPSSYAHPH